MKNLKNGIKKSSKNEQKCKKIAKEGEKMNVICISGKAQHGKDTSAMLMKREFESHGYSVLITHYGDVLKYICKEFFGWDGVKDDDGRQMLQTVGTNKIRYRNPDFFVNFLRDVLVALDDWDFVLIPDARFPNEVRTMQDAFRATHVRIERQNFISPLTEEQQKHPSEIALDNYPVEWYIDNCGTINDLRETVETFVEEYLK